jgi:prepilin-type N-terminal cleavage/methylation domain-containing protein
MRNKAQRNILNKKRGTAEKQLPKGLTLVELMITLAVLAILLVIATPSLDLFSSTYKLRGATREVATDLQFARLLAVKENKDIRVAFSPTSYQVVRVSDGSVAKTRNLSTDYPHITLTSTSITFDSRGDSSANTVTVANPRGARNVTVNSTGRVKIE